VSVVTGFAGATNTDVVSNPAIFNFAMPLANTEYGFTFPVNTRRYTLVNRTNGMIKYSFIPGDSGIIYRTIPPGTASIQTNLSKPSITIYLQSPSSNQILEIESWS
jgi:hypothetical protein